MPSTFTPPSWREDQPWAAEGPLLAEMVKGGPGAGTANIFYNALQSQRANAQGDYHNYIAAVNALQAQNLAFNQHEHGAQTVLKGLELGGKDPGSIDAYNASPYTSDFPINDPNHALATSAQQGAGAKNFGEIIGAAGRAGMAGLRFDPGQLGAMIPGGPTPVYGASPMENAAGINAAGRVAAAQAGGGGATVHTPVEAPSQDNNYSPATMSRKVPANSTPAQIAEMLKGMRPPSLGGGAGAIASGGNGALLPPAQPDTAGASSAPAAAPPVASGPTLQAATQKAYQAVERWGVSQNPADRARYEEVLKYSVDTKHAGVPIMQIIGNRIVVLGAGGKPYPVE